ncbi:MAG: hemolysin family protein, partial [Clostridia bacterium]
ILSVNYLPVVKERAGMVAAVAVVFLAAFVSVLVSRLTPVRIAVKNAGSIAAGAAPFMSFLAAVSYPIAFVAMWLSRLCAVLFGVGLDEKLEDVTEEEIRMMVDIGTESGAIAPEEQEFIKNIFEFDNMSAADVMTHRTDVAVLRLEDDPREWEKVARDCGFSRFPVCGETIDDIVGVVHARELYEFLYDGSGDIRGIIRPAYVIPETVPTDILFRNMQQEKNHIAIVVDEYGGFSGIVTMDDLLEELVGQINDEKEELEEEEPIIKIDEGTWEIDGTAPLDDVAAELGVDLPTEEYDTIGGLIFAQMDKIPDDGSTFEIEAYGLVMKVVKIEDRRIEKVLVCVAEPAKELEGSEEE